MTPTDAIRWTWTFLTGWGVLFAVWNLREVLIDNWAVSQVRTRPMDTVRLVTKSAVYEQLMIVVALAMDFLAGLFAIFGQPAGALIALILNAAMLIVLTFSQTRWRKRIFRGVQLDTRKGPDT